MAIVALRFSGWSCIAVALGLLAGCRSKPPDDPRTYVARIAAQRAEKDAAFQKDPDPVPASKKGALLPLSYFPIDPEYKVAAALKPSNDPTVVLMPTSTGQQRRERRAGTLEFNLKGQPMTLTAFVEADAPNNDRLFVPFSDMTSGTETYAAGRYLDLDRTGSGIYELDFNLAYNPYCYYNPTYECPYPPPESRLKIPVHAGEKLRR
jgi:uncharacterized protein